MAILKRYPHTLWFGECECMSQRTARNEDGDPIELPPTFTGSLECKAVPENAKGKDIVFDNGTAKRVSFVCYFQPQDHKFEFGERVKLTLTSGIEVTLLVANFIPYQKTHKLWLA